MLNLPIEKGEIRRFQFEARSNIPNEQLVITAVSWSLLQNGEATETGTGTVDGRKISVLVPFSSAGLFTLELTVEIPPEVIKERIDIQVTE